MLIKIGILRKSSTKNGYKLLKLNHLQVDIKYTVKEEQGWLVSCEGGILESCNILQTIKRRRG